MQQNRKKFGRGQKKPKIQNCGFQIYSLATHFFVYCDPLIDLWFALYLRGKWRPAQQLPKIDEVTESSLFFSTSKSAAIDLKSASNNFTDSLPLSNSVDKDEIELLKF